MVIESKRQKNGQWPHTIRLQHYNVIVKETVRGITKSQARICWKRAFYQTDLQTMLRYCHTHKSQEDEAVNRLQTHLEKETAQVLRLKNEYKTAQKLPN